MKPAIALLVPLSLLPACAPQAVPPDPQTQEDWRAQMAQIPTPGEGCYQATFPTLAWRNVPCVKPPDVPLRPARGEPPETVGNGNDYSASVSGTLTSSIGSFDSVVGVTSETDPQNEPNAFSLQLNSNTFTTTVCNGAANPAACQGWQQFVYINGANGYAFMQYWLINWNTTCPPGWGAYYGDCYTNSNGVGVPVQTIASLPLFKLTGSIAAGTDTVTMSPGNGNLYSATGQDTVLNLQQGWSESEFNIFGYCCGSQAIFNAGSTITVRTSVNNGTTNTPTCVQQGFTGETNNLTLVSPCCAFGGTSPAIVFTESNVQGATAACVCPMGQTYCVGGCTTTGTDPSNCGQCGHVCAMNQVCRSGQCVSACGVCHSPQVCCIGASGNYACNPPNYCQ